MTFLTQYFQVSSLKQLKQKDYRHIQCYYNLLFTLFDLDLDDVVRIALWLKLSFPGGKTISGSTFTYI